MKNILKKFRKTLSTLAYPFNRNTVKLYQKYNDLEGRIKQLEMENRLLLELEFKKDEWLLKNKDIHKGKRCFLLGCGPSLNKVDLSKIADEYSMGVNGTYLLKDIDLDYFISVSTIFWQHHRDGLNSFLCKRKFYPHYLNELTSASPTSWLTTIEYKQHKRVFDENIRPWFFSTNASHYVCLGGSVIFVALQILYWLGFDEVILLGIDHDYGIDLPEDKKEIKVEVGSLDAHFMKNYYPEGGSTFIDIISSERGFSLAKKQFEKNGRKLLNASPGSKLKIIDLVDYNSLFD